MNAFHLAVTPESIRAFTLRRAPGIIGVSLFATCVTAAILWFEYRLLLFAIVSWLPAVLMVIDTLSIRQNARGMASRPDGLAVIGPEGEQIMPWKDVPLVHSHPDVLVLGRIRDGQVERLQFPGTPDELTAIVEELRARGYAIEKELHPISLVAAMLVFLVISQGLGMVAGALALYAVLGGLVALFGGDASLWNAAAALFGVLVVLTIRALLIHLLADATAAEQ